VRTAIDANIISSIWSNEPAAEKVVEQLGMARQEGILLISPFAFAELHAHPNMTAGDVRSFLDATGIVIDYKLEEKVWAEAGLRYARYAARRRQSTGEGPRRILPDFLIGAHALVQAERLLTLEKAYDGKRMRCACAATRRRAGSTAPASPTAPSLRPKPKRRRRHAVWCWRRRSGAAATAA